MPLLALFSIWTAILFSAYAAPTAERPSWPQARDTIPSNRTSMQLGRPDEQLTNKIAEMTTRFPHLRLIHVSMFPGLGMTTSWNDADFQIYWINGYDAPSQSNVMARNCLPGQIYRWVDDVYPMSEAPEGLFTWTQRIHTVSAALQDVRREGMMIGAPGVITVKYEDHPRWAPDLAGVFYDFMDPHHMRSGAALGPDGIVYQTRFWEDNSSALGVLSGNGTAGAEFMVPKCGIADEVFS